MNYWSKLVFIIHTYFTYKQRVLIHATIYVNPRNEDVIMLPSWCLYENTLMKMCFDVPEIWRTQKL